MSDFTWSGKNVLITGANRGIGLGMAKVIAAAGGSVIGAVRSSSEELDKLSGVRVITGIEMTDDDCGKKITAALGDIKIDVVMANSGILQASPMESMDYNSARSMFDVNALGPIKVVTDLAPLLKDDESKVFIMSSLMGSVSDCGSAMAAGYRMSKSAANMAGVCLSHLLKPRNITVQVSLVEGVIEAILVVACFMWSGSLDSSVVLLSYHVMPLASPIIIILISTLKHTYLYLCSCFTQGSSLRT